MRRAGTFLRAFSLLLLPFLFFNTANIFAADDVFDDYVPPVTARVARISFARGGDAQIRRAGESDWERAAQNLPVVEGDEITTDADARLEIQFDSRTFLRLAENSYLKITTLKDEGVAVSLPEGNLSVRVLEFDKNRAFFEIDAPKTTVSVERAGMYRVDAGDGRKNSEVRVAVTDGGEARLYSETSGFTLRNGRSARIYLDGDYAGEWETSDAARYADAFDVWALERDALVAKRLQTAAYDKYYDREVYGAEDLSEHGEWIYTRKYGHVWRPFRNSVSSYANWSPYRYGHWRWVPPYGWTWVNDESWGWATYHHGRWVYVDDNWAWTPYPQRRARRSWWQPALVVVTYSGSLICWYPLPYDYGYYNYNSHYYSTYIDRRRTTIINNTTTNIIINPTPTPTPGEPGTRGQKFLRKPPILAVPESGVVAVDASEFGRRKGGFVKLSVETAKKVLSKTPFERTDETASIALPTRSDLNGRISREIAAENPRAEKVVERIRTGATERKTGASMDESLRREQIFGNRPPVEKNQSGEARRVDSSNTERRETGAVKRPVPRSDVERGDSSETRTRDASPVRSTGRRSEENSGDGGESKQPVSKPRERNREPETPAYSPPQQPEQRRERRQEPPQREEREERKEPQQREERREPQRREERREEPPRQPTPRSEPPPQQREEKAPPPSKQRETAVDKDNR